MTQKERVLKYLRWHRTITSMECQKKLEIVDLQKAIQLLRQEGYNITDKWISKKGKYGSVHYKKYKLERGK